MARQINKRFLFNLGLFVGLPLLLVVVFGVLFPIKATDWKRYLETAQSQFEKEQFYKSLVSTKQALRRGGDEQPEVHYFHARVLLKQKPNADSWGAVRAYRAAVKRKADYFEAQRDLTKLLMGQWVDMQTEGKRLVDMRPEFGMGYAWLANAMIRLGDIEPLEADQHVKYSEALDVLKKGIENAPDTLDLYPLLARAHAKLDEGDKIRQALELAVKNNPDSAPAHIMYAGYLLNEAKAEKDKKKAEELRKEVWDLLEKAKELDPDSADVYEVMANAAVSAGRFDDAIDYLKKAIDADPKKAPPYVQLAGLLRRRGEREKAENVLKKGLSEIPESLDLKAELAYLYLDSQNLKAAEALLEELDKKLADKPPWWPFLKGKEALLKGNVRQAVTYLKQAQKANEDDQRVKFLLAQAYFRAGELGAARDALQTYVARMPGDTRARRMLAAILLDLREYRDALQHAKMLVQINRDDSQGWLLLSKAQLAMGNTEDGLDSLNKAIQRDPDNDHAYWVLAGIEEKRGQLSKAEDALKKALATGKNKRTSYRQLLAFYRRNKEKQPGDFDKKLKSVLKEARKDFPDAIWYAFLLPAEPDAAIKFLQNTLRQEPDNINAMRYLAYRYSTSGQLDKAIDLFKKAYRTIGPQKPARARIRDRLFSLFLQEEKFDEAATLLKDLDEDDPNRLLAGAVLLLAKKDYNEAVKKLKSILETYETMSQGYFLLGQAYFAQKKLLDAVPNYERVLAVRPDDIPARLQLARTLLMLQRFPDALAQARLAIKYDANLVLAYEIIAVANEARSEYTHATKAREKLLALRPDGILNALRLSWLYERKGETDKARQVLEQAAERAPESLPAASGLANFYARNGQKLKGEAVMAAFVKKHSDDLRAHHAQGRFYHEAGNFRAALKSYDKAIRLAKSNNDKLPPMVAKAEAFVRLRQYADAVETYRNALGFAKKDNVGLLNRLAGILILKGDLPEALETVNAARKKFPDDTYLMVTQGRILMRRKKLEAAEKVLRSALAADPTLGEAMFYIGLIHLQRKSNIADYLQAIRQLSKISPKDPIFVRASKELAGVHEKLKEYSEAIRTIQRLLEVSPLDVLAKMNLARLYMANGQPAKAEGILKQLTDKRPDDAALRQQIARAQERQGKLGAARANYQQAWQTSRGQLLGALEGLTRLMSIMGQAKEAKTLLRGLIAKSPGREAFVIYLVYVHMVEKEWAEAEKLLTEAIEARPTSENLYLTHVRLCQAQGKPPKEIIAMLEKALKNVPKSVQIRMALCGLLINEGRKVEALRVAKEARDLARTTPRVLLLLGQAYYENKKPRQAIAITKEVLDLEPAHALANNNLAYMLAVEARQSSGKMREKKLAEARRRTNDALKLFRSNPSILDTSGYIYYLQKDFPRAEKALRDAIRFGDQAVAWYHLGLVYEATDRSKEAAGCYEKALELEPNFSEAPDAKKRLKKILG
ncbi:MAG: tetratricopeptide repeat protein [Planctomycetia bacterium]|nr:tetratricopeptide repeat protein [Planctomycetia bacterium]